MATKPRVEDTWEPDPIPIPPPVPDGDYHLESLGRFFDNLLGAARRQRRADRRLAEIVGDTQAPDDPPLLEIPEPIPNGDDPFIEGRDEDVGIRRTSRRSEN